MCLAGALWLAPAASLGQSHATGYVERSVSDEGFRTTVLHRDPRSGGVLGGSQSVTFDTSYIPLEIRGLPPGPRTFGDRLAANLVRIEIARRLARNLDPHPILLHPLGAETWNLLTRWAMTSCPGEAGEHCLDPGDPFVSGRCSLREPLSCQRLAALDASIFEQPDFLLDALEIDRARVREGKRGTRVRLRGVYEADSPLPEDGAVAVLLGELAVSIPLSDFRDMGTYLKWRGGREGLRAIKLHRDGRFLIKGRRIQAEVLDGNVLPFLLQVGDHLGGRFVSLH